MNDLELTAQSGEMEETITQPTAETPAPEVAVDPEVLAPEVAVDPEVLAPAEPAPLEEEAPTSETLDYQSWVKQQTGDGSSEIEKQFSADPVAKYRAYSGYVRQSLLENGEWDDEVISGVDERLANMAVESGDFAVADPEVGATVADVLRKPKSEELPLDSLLSYTMNQDDEESATRRDSVAKLIALKQNPNLATPESLASAEATVREWVNPEMIVAAEKDQVVKGRKLAAAVPPPVEGGAPDVVINESLLQFVKPDGSINDRELGRALKLSNVDPELYASIRQKISTPAGYEAPYIKIQQHGEFMSSLDAVAKTRDKFGGFEIDHLMKVMTRNVETGDEDYIARKGVPNLNMILKDQAFWKNASEEEKVTFTTDYIKANQVPEIDKENPAAALIKLSTGEMVAPIPLMLDEESFEKALGSVPKEQQDRLRQISSMTVEANAKNIIKVFAENPQGGAKFVNFMQDQRDAGKKDGEIVKEWVAKGEFSAAGALGIGVAASLKDSLLPFLTLTPIDALDDFAMKAMVDSQLADSNRREYAKLFGYEHGMGYDLSRLVAPVAIDLLATKGATSAAVAVGRSVARATIANSFKAFVGRAVSAEASTLAKRWAMSSAKAGAESAGVKLSAKPAVEEVIDFVGKDILNTAYKTTAFAGTMVTSYNRSAQSTYASLSTALANEKNPDGSAKYTTSEVKEIALNHSIAAGTITMFVVGGFSLMGREGVEAVLNRGLSKSQLQKVYTRLSSDLGKVGTDIDMTSASTMLRSMIKKTITPIYKSAGVKRGLDEMLEEGTESVFQTINTAMAMGESVNIKDMMKQAVYEGALGGIMGDAMGGVAAGFKNQSRPDVATEADMRRAKLLEIAEKLDATSPQTSQVLRNFATNQRNLFPQQVKLEGELATAKGEQRASIQSQLDQLRNNAAQDPKQRLSPTQENIPQTAPAGGNVPTPSNAGMAGSGTGVPATPEAQAPAVTPTPAPAGETRLAKRLAKIYGLDINKIKPSGQNNTVTPNDVRKAAEKVPATTGDTGGTTTLPTVKMYDPTFRDAIGKNVKFEGYEGKIVDDNGRPAIQTKDGTLIEVPASFLNEEAAAEVGVTFTGDHASDREIVLRVFGETEFEGMVQIFSELDGDTDLVLDAAEGAEIDLTDEQILLAEEKIQAAITATENHPTLDNETKQSIIEKFQGDLDNIAILIGSRDSGQRNGVPNPTGSAAQTQQTAAAPTRAGVVAAANAALGDEPAAQQSLPEMRDQLEYQADLAEANAMRDDISPEQAQAFVDRVAMLRGIIRDANTVIQAEGKAAEARALDPDGKVYPSADPADVIAIAEARGVTPMAVLGLDSSPLSDVFFEMPADYPMTREEATLLSVALVMPAQLGVAMYVNPKVADLVRGYLQRMGVDTSGMSTSNMTVAQFELLADPVLKPLRGDDSPSTKRPATNAKVMAGLAKFDFNKGLPAFLKSVVKKSKEYSQVAQLLETIGAGNVVVKLVSMPNTGAAGFYIPSNGTIVINTAVAGPRGVEDTILHELIHAVTESALKNPTPAQKAAIKRIDRLRNAVIKKAKQNGTYKNHAYGLSDNSEFITHFFTSEDFRNIVGSMTPNGETNWKEALVGFIRDMLTAGKGFSTAQLTDLQRDLFSLIDTPRIGLNPSSGVLNQPAVSEDVARFAELVTDLPHKPTQAQIDAWKEANPSKYAYLKEMREEVLRAAGYDLKAYHGGVEKITSFDEGFAGLTTADNEHGAFYFSDVDEVADDYRRQAFIRRYQDNPEGLVDDGIITQKELFNAMTGDMYAYVDELAENNGNLVSAFIKMERPLVVDARGANLRDLEKRFNVQNAIGFLKGNRVDEIPDGMYEAMAYTDEQINEYRSEIEDKAREDNGLEADEEIEDWMMNEAAREFLSDYGIEQELPDGIIIRNVIDDIGDRSNQNQDVHIVLDPTSIKSTEPLNLDNDGKLITPDKWGNVESSDIRFQPSEDTSSSEFLDKFTDSANRMSSFGGRMSLGGYDTAFHVTTKIKHLLAPMRVEILDRVISNAAARGDTDKVQKYADKKAKIGGVTKFLRQKFADYITNFPTKSSLDLRTGEMANPYEVVERFFPDGEKGHIEEDIRQIGLAIVSVGGSKQDVLNLAELAEMNGVELSEGFMDEMFMFYRDRTRAQSDAEQAAFLREVTNPEFYDVTKDEGMTLSRSIKFQPASDEDYMAAVEAGDMETAQRMVDEAARAAGYGEYSHRRKDKISPRDTGHVVLFADRDGGKNSHYGQKEYLIKSDQLMSEVPSWMIEEYKKYSPDYPHTDETAVSELQPYDIVESAQAWDDPQWISELWNFHEDKLGDFVGIKTPDGAAVWDSYSASIKSADPITRDDSGNIIPPSKRFNPESSDIRFQPSEDDYLSTDPEEIAKFFGSFKTPMQMLESMIPARRTTESLGIDVDTLMAEAEPLDYLAKRKYIEAAVNHALARKAGDATLEDPEAYTKAFELIARGRFQGSEVAAFRANKSAREKLIKYLEAAIVAIYARTGENVATQVLASRIRDTYANARVGFHNDINTHRVYEQTELRLQPAVDDQGFYSQLEEVITTKVPNSATPAQIMGTISNPSSGVKAEEIKWSGIEVALGNLAVNGKVSKDALLEYLRAEGAVTFEEVTMGRPSGSTLSGTYQDPDTDEWVVSYPGGEQRFVTLPEAIQFGNEYNRNAKTQEETKYGQYQLPGGKNYREVVLAMPVKDEPDNLKKYWVKSNINQRTGPWSLEEAEGRVEMFGGEIIRDIDKRNQPSINYTSSHFTDVPNYVAHMRLNDRTDAEGNEGLFIEEIQSDRHQAGRKKGYREDAPAIIEEGGKFGLTGYNRWYPTRGEAEAASKELNAGIPDAPFRTTWPLALFKRALRDAVASGKTWIGWTTGDTQGDRYDLSKSVNSIKYLKNKNETFEIIIKGLDGQIIHEQTDATLSQLEELIGKEITEKIVNNEGDYIGKNMSYEEWVGTDQLAVANKNLQAKYKTAYENRDSESYKELTGANLKIKAPGMVGFYDNMLPKEIGKYVAKLGGGNVEKSSIPTPESSKRIDDLTDAELLQELKRDKDSALIWRVNITPAMAASVSGGQLRFQPAESEYPSELSKEEAHSRAAEMPMNAVNVLHNDSDIFPKPEEKTTNEFVAALIADQVSQIWGRKITSKDITQEQIDTIVAMGVQEFEAALKASGKNAGDWYSTAIEAAMAVAGVIHPELVNPDVAAQSPGFMKYEDPAAAADLTMRLALAITSQNLSVELNTRFAEEQFEFFKRTGRFDSSKVYGEKAESISGNLELANEVIDLVGFEGALALIEKEFTVGELKAHLKKVTGRSISVSGNVEDVVNGAAMFGPKIGQGFLQNIMGKFTPVTIDLWMRRTWGRWTGDVVGSGVTPTRLARLLDSARDFGIDLGDIKNIRAVTMINGSGNSYRTVSPAVSKRLGSDPEFRDAIVNVARKLHKMGQAHFALSRLPTTAEVLSDLASGKITYKQFIAKQQSVKAAAEKAFTPAASKALRERNAARVKAGETNKKNLESKATFIEAWYTKNGYTETIEKAGKIKPEWSKASAVIVNALKPTDVPSNKDREVITTIVNRIREELLAKGYVTTNADVQAVLWYPEKDLWAKLRGEDESNLKSSYDEQFISIAEQRGLGAEARAAAATAAEQSAERKLRTARDSGTTDEGTTPGTDTPVGGQGQGGIKFQPAAPEPSVEHALNRPSRLAGFMRMFFNDKGVLASADKDPHSRAWVNRLSEMFVKQYGKLSESATKSKLNRDALNRTVEETVARLGRRLSSSIKNENANAHLVQLAAGNPDPLITEAVEKQIIRAYEDEIMDAEIRIDTEVLGKKGAEQMRVELMEAAIATAERNRNIRIWEERTRAAETRREQQMDALAELERTAPETYEALIDLRAFTNDLQRMAREVNAGNPQIQAIIDQSMSVYLVRSFAVHQDPKQIDLMLNSQDPEYVARREALIRFFEIKAKEEIMKEIERDPAFLATLGENYDSAKIAESMELFAGNRPTLLALEMFNDFMIGHQTEKGLFGGGSDVSNEITRYMKKMNMPQEFLDALMVNTDPVFNMINTSMSLGRLVVNANMLSEIARSGIESGRYISKAEKESGFAFADSKKLLREVLASDGNEELKADIRQKLFFPLYSDLKQQFKQGLIEEMPTKEAALAKLDAALTEFGNSNKSLTEILPALGSKADRLISDLFVSSKKLPLAVKDKMVPSRGKYANWTALVSENQGNAAYAPLGGLYASPEQVEAFKATFHTESKTAEHLSQKALSGLNKILISAAGASLGVATLGSPAYFVRNVFGGLFYTTMNGVNPMDGNLQEEAFKFMKQVLLPSGEITPEFQELIAGRIAMDGAQIGYLKQLIESMKDTTTLERLGEIAGTADSKMNVVGRKGKQAIKGAFNKLQAFAEVTEVYPAVMTYVDFKLKLTEANFGTELEIQQEASRLTKMVMPSKSEASSAVNAFTGSGIGALFGAFIRFKAEVIRNTVNSAKLAHEWSKSDNPVLKKYGQRKMIAFGTIAGLITVAMPIIAQRILQGIGDDEDEAIRSSLPTYLRNSSLYYNFTDDGVRIFNLTFTNPYSFTLDPISRSVNAIIAGDPEEIPGVIAHFIAEDMFGENILASNVMDSARNIDSSTNKPIYFESDSGSTKILKQVGHIGKSYLPRLFVQTGRFSDAIQRDTTEADFFDTPLGVAVATVAPFKPMSKSFDDMERSSLNDIRKKKSELWMITSPIMSPKPLSADEAVDLMQQRSDMNTRIAKETLAKVRGFAKLRQNGTGVTESAAIREISRNAEDAGLSKERFNRLVRNKTDERLVLPEESMRKIRDNDPARYDAIRKFIRSRPRYIPVD